MPTSLIVMAGLGLVAGAFGLPPLVDPAAVRARFGWRDTPPLAYALRIVGAMLAALGLILIVFAATYWRSAG